MKRVFGSVPATFCEQVKCAFRSWPERWITDKCPQKTPLSIKRFSCHGFSFTAKPQIWGRQCSLLTIKAWHYLRSVVVVLFYWPGKTLIFSHRIRFKIKGVLYIWRLWPGCGWKCFSLCRQKVSEKVHPKFRIRIFFSLTDWPFSLMGSKIVSHLNHDFFSQINIGSTCLQRSLGNLMKSPPKLPLTMPNHIKGKTNLAFTRSLLLIRPLKLT